MFKKAQTAFKAVKLVKPIWNSSNEISKILDIFSSISVELEDIMPKWAPYSKPIQEIIKTFQEEYEKIAEDNGHVLRLISGPTDQALLSSANDKEVFAYLEKDKLCYIIKQSSTAFIKDHIEEGMDENKLDKKYFDQFKNFLSHVPNNPIEQITIDCKLAFLDLTARRGHTPSDPWRLFFSALKRIVGIIDNLSSQFSDGKDISIIANLFSHLMLQSLQLLRAFDNLDLDLVLGLVVPQSVDDMRKKTYGLATELVKKILPNQMRNGMAYIQSTILNQEDFQKRSLIEKKIILVVAGYTNHIYCKLHLLLDELEINFNLKPKSLSNMQLNGGALPSLAQLNEEFSNRYLILMKLALYSTDNLYLYPYDYLIQENRKTILCDTIKMLETEKNQINQKREEIEKTCLKLINDEIFRFEMEEKDEKLKNKTIKVFKKLREELSKQIASFEVAKQPEVVSLALSEMNVRALDGKEEDETSNDEYHSIIEDNNSITDLQSMENETDNDDYFSFTEEIPTLESLDKAQHNEKKFIDDDVFKSEIVSIDRAFTILNKKLKELPNNETLKTLCNTYREYKHNIERTHRKYNSLVERILKLEKIVSLTHGDKKADQLKEQHAKSASQMAAYQNEYETMVNHLFKQMTDTTGTLKSLMKTIFEDPQKKDNEIMQDHHMDMAEGNLPVHQRHWLASIENAIVVCEDFLDKALNETIYPNWRENFTLAKEAISILIKLKPQFESCSDANQKPAFPTPESDLFDTSQTMKEAFNKLAILTSSIRQIQNDPIVGQLVSLLGLDHAFSHAATPLSAEQQPENKMISYCMEFLSNQLGEKTFNSFQTTLMDLKKDFSDLATFSILSPWKQNALLLMADLINQLFRKMFLVLDHLETKFFMKQNYLVSIPLFDQYSLKQLYDEFYVIYYDNMQHIRYSFDAVEVYPFVGAKLQQWIATHQQLINHLQGIQSPENKSERYRIHLQIQSINERILKAKTEYPDIAASIRGEKTDWDTLIESTKELYAKFIQQDHAEPYDFKEIETHIQFCDTFAQNHFDRELYEKWFCQPADIEHPVPGPFVFHFAHSLQQLKKLVQNFKKLQLQFCPQTDHSILNDAKSSADYAFKMEQLVSETYKEMENLKSSINQQMTLIKPFVSVDAIKKFLQQAMTCSSDVILKERKENPLYACLYEQCEREAASIPKRWQTVTDALQDILVLFGKSSCDDSEIVTKEVDLFFNFLSHWQIANQDKLQPLNSLEIIGFCLHDFEKIWNLINYFSQTQSIIWDAAGTALLKLAQVINLVFRDIYLLMDRIEIECCLEEGKLKNLPIYNQMSLKTVIESFHHALSGYAFQPDEQYPYHNVIAKQRRVILEKVRGLHYSEDFVQFIETKIHPPIITSNRHCPAKEALLLQIDGRINQLTEQRTKRYYFFAASRKAKHEDHIDALFCLRNILQQPGYTLENTQQTNAIDQLYTHYTRYYHILLNQEQKLLHRLQEIDKTISPAVRGMRQINFIPSLNVFQPKPVVDCMEQFHIFLINKRINELKKEIEKQWMSTRTKEIKIELLRALRSYFTEHQSLDKALYAIRNDQAESKHFYLLLEGRTGVMIQEIQHTQHTSADRIRRIDIEIARLKRQAGKARRSEFFNKARLTTLHNCIEALTMLRGCVENQELKNQSVLDIFSQQYEKFYKVLHLHEATFMRDFKLREDMVMEAQAHYAPHPTKQ